MKKILIISAHPDDAELAMGGTILKYNKKGFLVKNIIASIPNNLSIRKQEAIESSKLLNMSVEFLFNNYPKGVEHYTSYELITALEPKILEYNPDIIFTHWDEDSHQDHRILSAAVQSSLRLKKCTLYFFEQINQQNIFISGKFTPNVYSNITNYMDIKLESLKLHKSQMNTPNSKYLDDIVSLNSWRGHQVDKKFAEAFMLVFQNELIN